MNHKIPIIFIHFSDNLYLEFTLRQARYCNPNTPIYLLSNCESHKTRFPFLKHYLISDFCSEIEYVNNIYSHQSENEFEFELNCILRWFVLMSFMKHFQLNEILHLDSDVLIYETPEFFKNKYMPRGFTLADSQSPHCLYIANIEVLESFCASIVNYYASKEKNEGVSDMFFFRRFGNINPHLVCELMTSVDGYVVDNNINNPDGFEQNIKGIKKMEFNDRKIPFGILSENRKAVYFIALHFQGSAKKYIPDYLTVKISTIFLLRHKSLWFLKDLKKALKKLR